MTGIWRPFTEPEYKKPWKIIKLIRQIVRDIKWSHQRIWKGYCDYDLFSIDDWFTKIMPNMLKEFKKNRHSSPVGSNCIAHAIFMNEEERDQDFHSEWDKVLERMIFLLGEMDDATCSQQNPYEDEYFEVVHKLMKKPVENADGTFTRRYPNLADYPEYRELEEKYDEEEHRVNMYRQNCKEEFFKLFDECFYDLWD